MIYGPPGFWVTYRTIPGEPLPGPGTVPHPHTMSEIPVALLPHGHLFTALLAKFFFSLTFWLWASPVTILSPFFWFCKCPVPTSISGVPLNGSQPQEISPLFPLNLRNFGNIWRHFWFPGLWRGMPQISFDGSPVMLLKSFNVWDNLPRQMIVNSKHQHVQVHKPHLFTLLRTSKVSRKGPSCLISPLPIPISLHPPPSRLHDLHSPWSQESRVPSCHLATDPHLSLPEAVLPISQRHSQPTHLCQDFSQQESLFQKRSCVHQ